MNHDSWRCLLTLRITGCDTMSMDDWNFRPAGKIGSLVVKLPSYELFDAIITIRVPVVVKKGDNNLTNVNPGRTTALTESSWWSHMTKGMGSYGVPSSETERLMMCRILTVVLGPYQPDWRKWIIWHQKSLPFASIITFNMQRRYRWWKKSCTTWDVKKPVVKNGINHQPQLVSVPDFWQDPLDVKTCKAWRVPATLGKGNSRDPGPCLFFCLTHDSPPCKCVSICVSEICRSDF